jgi:hypothetical protein
MCDAGAGSFLVAMVVLPLLVYGVGPMGHAMPFNDSQFQCCYTGSGNIF